MLFCCNKSFAFIKNFISCLDGGRALNYGTICLDLPYSTKYHDNTMFLSFVPFKHNTFLLLKMRNSDYSIVGNVEVFLNTDVRH